MPDTICLKVEDTVRSIVNNLAKSIVTEMTERCILKPGQEEELDALLDVLCAEAINNILRIVELLNTTKQHDPPPDNLNKSSQTEEDLGTVETSASTSVPYQPATKTIIVICKSALPSFTQALVKVETENCQSGTTEPDVSIDENPENTPDDVCSVASPPAATDHQDDDECAQPPPSPLISTGVENAGATTTTPTVERKGKKTPPSGRTRRRRKKICKAPEPSMNHSCPRCTAVFPSAERLAEHQGKAHRECKVCGEFFSGVIKLRDHEIKAHGILPYVCTYCDRRFTHKGHYDLHVKTRHTGEKTCHCDICGKGYSSATSLKAHKLTHANKTFTCDVCGKGFYQAGHLVRHKLVHEGVKPYRCPTCGRGFTQAVNMAKHQAVHADHQKQLCSLCGKSYATRDGLRNHMVGKHAHELPPEETLLPADRSLIACEVCGKKFLHPSQHRLHMKTHTGDRPFSCEVCGKSYRQKQILRDHMNTHTGERPYECGVCGKTFNLFMSFTRHQNAHGGALPYLCTVCGKGFNRVTSFTRHKRIHQAATGEVAPYSCEHCGKHFRLLAYLQAHQMTLGHRKRVAASGLKASGDLTQETDLLQNVTDAHS